MPNPDKISQSFYCFLTETTILLTQGYFINLRRKKPHNFNNFATRDFDTLNLTYCNFSNFVFLMRKQLFFICTFYFVSLFQRCFPFVNICLSLPDLCCMVFSIREYLFITTGSLFRDVFHS